MMICRGWSAAERTRANAAKPAFAMCGVRARPPARYPLFPAPVAQWTERRPSKPRVGGSNPPRRTPAANPAALYAAMMICRGIASCRRAVVANAGEAGIRGESSAADRERQTEAILSSSAVAVAQLVEPLVVVQVVVGSSPISHPLVSEIWPEAPLRCDARPRSSADRATDFESVRGGSTPPGATPSVVSEAWRRSV